MTDTEMPLPIRRLTVSPFLRWMLEGGDSSRPVRTTRLRELNVQALGPGHRKRTGHFEPAGERTVRSWLRLHQLTLFVPSAEAALQSLLEEGRLDAPSFGKHYSVYAMLPSQQIVALVAHETDAGRRIVNGLTELPYDAEAQAVAADIADPMLRVQAAAIIDAHAAVESTVTTIELGPLP